MNYLLFGEQYPLIKKTINKILKERIGEIDELNVSKYDLDSDNLDDAILDARTLPLGYERKAVIFDNCNYVSKNAKKEIVEKLVDLINESSDEIDILLISRTSEVDQGSKIYKKIQDNGKFFEFNKISKEDWPIIAKKFFANRQCKISPDAINELLARTNNDLTLFMNEASKLSLYKDDIQLIDVVEMVSKPIENNAFEMSNALFKGDNATAISIFRDLKLFGKKATDGLIPLLANQFRFYSEVFYLSQKGFDINEISNELKCNSYRVKIALQSKKNFTYCDVLNALDDLYYLDYQIKSGQIDHSYGLELFLINFPN